VLHGAAAREAQQQQLVSWAVSITHTSTHAAAVAVALGRLEPSTAIGEQDRP
jgi:phosphopantetheinyl transferase (holo-ACP synthase)